MNNHIAYQVLDRTDHNIWQNMAPCANPSRHSFGGPTTKFLVTSAINMLLLSSQAGGASITRARLEHWFIDKGALIPGISSLINYSFFFAAVTAVHAS